LADAICYQRCLILGQLGRCLDELGQPEQAANYYQQELTELKLLEPSQQINQEMSIVQTDLADALTNMGNYSEARKVYKTILSLDQKLKNTRNQAVVQHQQGNLEMFQGNMQEAEKHYHEARKILQLLNEHNSEATVLHQLGMLYQKNRQWEKAEEVYRQSVQIKEMQGDWAGAAKTWNHLAQVNSLVGKFKEAECWFRKAIEAGKVAKNWLSVSGALKSLAALLKHQSQQRLEEALKLAKKALHLEKKLEPGATEIWKTYNILADIADKQGNAQEAKKNRRLARESKANFAGTRYELKQKYSQLILAVARGENVEAALEGYGEDWENLKTAIQQILAGERDVDKLCEPLTFHDAPIITAILEGIERPESLEWFEQDCTN